MSKNRGMNKDVAYIYIYIYIYISPLHLCAMEYYSAIKEGEIMPFAATWMDLF